MVWHWYLLALIVSALAILLVWRAWDARADQLSWDNLTEHQTVDGSVFQSSLVADLPEPAQRYFNYTIETGTLLKRVAEIEMEGELSLGRKGSPNYRPMKARQISAAPFGFVWSLKWNGVSGSDGARAETSWTRFWLFNIVPIVHAGGDDHRRSSFGRMVADSVFWAPASMLPSEHVTWQALGPDSARVIVRYDDLEQGVDVHVDAEGKPYKIVFERWSDENPDKVHRFQPFGGDLSGFESFGGYRLPTRVVAGNHYGTPDYVPFFKADVTDVQFPKPKDK
ncbi:MAG: DUF6544 family protein [Pseudomonadota bacterium]